MVEAEEAHTFGAGGRVEKPHERADCGPAKRRREIQVRREKGVGGESTCSHPMFRYFVVLGLKSKTFVDGYYACLHSIPSSYFACQSEDPARNICVTL